MKNGLKAAAVGGTCGLLFGGVVVPGSGNLYLYDILKGICLPASDICLAFLIEYMLCMTPLFLFQMLFGTLLYGRYCTASVYYFIRQCHKGHWYFGELARLLGLAAVYVFSMAAVPTILQCLCRNLRVDWISLVSLLYYLVIYTLYLFTTTLCINLCALYLGSAGGFSLLFAVQLFLVFTLLLWDRVLPLTEGEQCVRNARLLSFHPLSPLSLGWHTTALPGWNAVWNYYGTDFSLNQSFLTYWLAAICAAGVGYLCVRKNNILVGNRETGGI